LLLGYYARLMNDWLRLAKSESDIRFGKFKEKVYETSGEDQKLRSK
jgi:hypothetical protein